MNENNDDFKELIDITEEVDALDEEVKFTCFKRALDKLGIPHDEATGDNDELERVFSEELKIAAVEAIMGRLQEDGFVEAVAVDESGDVCYSLTDKGRKYVEDNYGET